ncbi:MAG TPA: peptidase S10 [Ideonella sp.]|uniref:S10 family peptidase n=1 Tax=Ideonella sp. TaxID=1929293 RepID=UPI002E37F8DC|nr:peptidase S10 [Ideonella sp.]HEX5687988.1 peptidase S10 [Ideonella sp.]
MQAHKTRAWLAVGLALATLSSAAWSTNKPVDAPQRPASAPDDEDKLSGAANDPRLRESQRETTGSVQVGGQRVDYRAIAGLMAIDHSKEEPGASMSYVAYFRRGGSSSTPRPVTFLYNGGPGSATLWLHMGAFGPQRVVTANGLRGPAAPYKVVDNEFSLLDATDLVFIDAPGTGFGRVVAVDKDKEKEREKQKEMEKEFYGVDQDARAFAQFIQKFLTRHQLWNAPKYLFGESYGTTRSAVLAARLQHKENIDLNGVILLSQILNFNLSVDEAQFNPGIDLPYALALPSYAATAWYHRRLPAFPKDGAALEPLLAEVRQFALGDYLQALQAGSKLAADKRRQVIEQLARYTGLKPAYIDKADLRINGGMFAQNLLDDLGQVVGRFDTRYAGPAIDRMSKEADYDAQSAAISPAYVAAYNHYLRTTLKFGGDMVYKPEIDVWRDWDWRHQPPGLDFPLSQSVNVMPDLAAAMKINPRLKVQMHAGYYDLATTFFAAEFELEQLSLPPALRNNIEVRHYPAGHMMYDDPASLKLLHDEVARFIRATDNLTR